MDPDLDFEYMPSKWNHQNLSPDEVLSTHCKVTSSESTKARKELFVIANIQYGTTVKNAMDLYFAANTVKSGSKLFVYIHGGYWEALSKEDSAYFALPLCSSSTPIIFVAADYVLSTEKHFGEKARMKSMWHEMTFLAVALTSIARTLRCSGIHICGHSAGAHLVAAMLAQPYPSDWKHSFFFALKSVWLLSGIFDLEPIKKTSVNDTLELSEWENKKCSPVNCIAQTVRNMMAYSVVVNIMYGQHDPPVFHEQSERFFKLLKDAVEASGEVVHLTVKKPVEVPDRDHFDLVDDIDLNKSAVLQNILKFLAHGEGMAEGSGTSGEMFLLTAIDFQQLVNETMAEYNAAVLGVEKGE